ncbi:MAG TPA: zinc ribbon domain-containing protein [Conexibacter sp.]|nr:zinc ribbon domain-containing protein [Conexibacter sp.]
MTQASHNDTTAAWLACAECQAPLDATQRYCVSCGARHTGADNPAARYFGALAARRRTPAPRPPRRGVGIGIATLLAVLPLAVGGGVLVGRAGHGDDALLQALRSQKPTVVNVGGGSGGGTGTSTAGGSGAGRGAGDGGAAGTGAVVATGIGGVAHSVLHHTSTAATRARDKQVVRRVSQQIGKSYVKAQRDLPDVIDVQSDPGAGAPAPTGAGD